MSTGLTTAVGPYDVPCTSPSGHRPRSNDDGTWCWVCGLLFTGRLPLNRRGSSANRRIVEACVKRDGPGCRYCRSESVLEIEHVVPRSRGGASDMRNYVAACRYCNGDKADRTPDEWFDALRAELATGARFDTERPWHRRTWMLRVLANRR